ncbi:MAG: Tad domain-containing protein [Pseudomonadota bacterium]
MNTIPKFCAQRLRRAIGCFQKDERGSITIQMIIFSLLLMMSMGLVLDSGRVYTQHNQIQAFTDQAALAAASELDGQTDSLHRAVKAVFGPDLSNPSPYLRKAGIEVGEFEIHYIGFYDVMRPSDEMQPSMVDAFPSDALVAQAVMDVATGEVTVTAVGGDLETASQAALYAVVGAVPEGAESATFGIFGPMASFFDKGSGGGTYFDTPGVLGYTAVSAATLAPLSCADLHTLVFCNPWSASDVPYSPFDQSPDSALYSFVGRSLMHFAPNYSDPTNRQPATTGNEGFIESIYPWDVNNQLFNLVDPLSDRSGVCDSSNVPIEAGEDYIVARDRCLMARAQQDQVCWSERDPLRILPAHGPNVSKAVNTIFDMWMEPFTSAIENSGAVPDTGMSYHQFFEPDAVATTLYETADRYTEPTVDASGNVISGGPGTMQDGDPDHELDALGTAILGNFANATAPRVDIVQLSKIGRVTGMVDRCHQETYEVNGHIENGVDLDAIYAKADALAADPTAEPLTSFEQSVIDNATGACTNDFIGDYFSQVGQDTSYNRSQMEDYWSIYNVGYVFTGSAAQQNVGSCGTVLEDLFDGLSDFCKYAILDPGIETFYELYQRERELTLSNIAEIDGSLQLIPSSTPLIQTNDALSSVTGPVSENGGLWCNDEASCDVNRVTAYGLSAPGDDFIKHMPEDFFEMSSSDIGTMFQSGVERRRIRAAMVNCQATVANGTDDDGFYSVAEEDLRLVDVYIPQPAKHACGLSSETDPTSGALLPMLDRVQRCDVDSSTETQLFIETIEDVTDTVTQTFTAHLVR